MYQHTRRKALALTALPLVVLLAACGGDSDPSADAAAVADVKEADLKGATITVGDFFGDCIDAVGTKTDLSDSQTECETMRILNNKFNAENPSGITVNLRRSLRRTRQPQPPQHGPDGQGQPSQRRRFTDPADQP